MKNRLFILLFIFSFLAGFSLHAMNVIASTKLLTKKIYVAKRTNPHPPKIDGKMDDPAWQHAMVGKDFVQHEPYNGKPPTEPTFFRITYDDKYIYVCIRAKDSQPDKIVRRVTRRDEGGDADQVGILFDSYYDQRTAFEFGVNAAGVREDAVFSNDGDSQDDSWDPVWEAAVSVDDSGWTAEMRIPFSQLRFANKPEQVWGLEVFRKLYRKQELSLWQFVPKDASGFVHLFGELHGIKNVFVRRRIELLPYSVGKIETQQPQSGNPFAPGRETFASFGLDGKIGITSDLTMDLTVNPDFGQVEADPSVVNLTAFETFYEEKRPFFIEGRNILDFRLGTGDGDFARETLFYSRRIGRTPHYNPDIKGNEHVRMPENTTILSAAKLTGKTRNGYSVGILDAVTAQENAEIDSAGNRKRVVVEPLTNYFVGRLQKDYNQGNTILGGMLTATNRRINREHLNFLNRAAYTGGIDFSHQWKNRTYRLDIKTAFSYIKGHRDALLAIQTSPVHYFQRPDANYLKLDSSRTSLWGHGGSISIGKVATGHWQYILGGVWRSPGLELNDLGYLQNADKIVQFVWIGYREWNPTKLFREYSINFNQWNGWNFGKEKLFSGGNINGWAQFVNYWNFGAGIGKEGPSLSTSATRGGPALRLEGGWRNWFNIFSDERKPSRFGVGGSNFWSDDNISRQHNIFFSVTWKPSNALNLRLNPFYNYNLDDMQYIATTSFNGEKRYIFGRINQKTLGVTIRLNFSLTPNLSIQYYGQPFISAGKYTHFKQITRPRAGKYQDRFHEFTSGEITYSSDNETFYIDENHDGSVDYSFGKPDFKL